MSNLDYRHTLTSQVDKGVKTGIMTTYPCASTTDITDAVTAINAGSTYGVIELQNGLTYVVTSTITLNASKVLLRGNGATIDGTGIGASTPVFRLDHSGGSSQFQQTPYQIEDLRVLGTASSGTAFLIDGSQSSRSARITMKNVYIENFQYGLDFQDYAYLCKFYSVDVNNADCCIRIQTGTDAGENNSFYGCAFYNSDLVISIANANSDTYMFGCSLDYNAKSILMTGGNLELHGCHLEGNSTGFVADMIDIDGDGTTCSFFGGKFLQVTVAPLSAAYYFNVRNAAAKLTIKDAFMHNLLNSANQMATGPGKFLIRGTNTYNTGMNTLPSMLTDQTHSNQLIDGGFEATTVQDYWCIVNDNGSVPTSRLTGSIGTVATSTAQAHAGSRSLLIDKTATGAFQVAIFAPVTEGDRLSGRFWFYTPSSGGLGGATVTMSIGWSSISGNDGNGMPVFTSSEVGSSTFVPTSTWTAGNARMSNSAPNWATHAYIRFSIPTGTTGDLHIDDMVVNRL